MAKVFNVTGPCITGKDELKSSEMYKASLPDKNLFVRDGHLDMRRILEKFCAENDNWQNT